MSDPLHNPAFHSYVARSLATVLLLMIFSTTGGSSTADPLSWRLIKDAGEIKIFSRPIPGQAIDEIKATTRIKATIPSWLSLFEDETRAPDWLYHCVQAKTLEKGSDWITTYIETDFPWPLKDRYSIIRSEYRWDRENQSIQVVGTTHHIDIHESNHLVRVQMAKNLWQVDALEEGYIEVTVSAQVDPGGIIPKWIVNHATAYGPYYSLLKMRRILESESAKPSQKIH